jgi:hypothetical protein
MALCLITNIESVYYNTALSIAPRTLRLLAFSPELPQTAVHARKEVELIIPERTHKFYIDKIFVDMVVARGYKCTVIRMGRRI